MTDAMKLLQKIIKRAREGPIPSVDLAASPGPELSSDVPKIPPLQVNGAQLYVAAALLGVEIRSGDTACRAVLGRNGGLAHPTASAALVRVSCRLTSWHQFYLQFL